MSSQYLLPGSPAPFTREDIDLSSLPLFDQSRDSSHALLEAGSLTSSSVNRLQTEKPLSPDEFLSKLLLEGEKITTRLGHVGFSPDLGYGLGAMNPGEMILTNQRILLMARSHSSKTVMTRRSDYHVASTLQDLAFFQPFPLSACKTVGLDYEMTIEASASIFSRCCDCGGSNDSASLWKVGHVEQKVSGRKSLVVDIERVGMLRVNLFVDLPLHVAMDFVAEAQKAMKEIE